MSARYCVIGLGQFGYELAITLAQEAEVLALDLRQPVVDRIADRVQRALRLDARNRETLAGVVTADFDGAVVGITSELEASVLTVLHLKHIGVPRITAKAATGDHAQILEALGVDEVIFPERELARQLAARILHPNLLDYITLGPEYMVMELSTPEPFHGHTLAELELPKRYGAMVLAVKEGGEKTVYMPGPTFVVKPDDILLLTGPKEQLPALQSGSDAGAS